MIIALVVLQVRLDSGREEPWERVHLETARPQVIVPDVRVDGRYLAPKEAWETVSLHYFRLLDQAESRRRQPGRKALESWERLRSGHAAWRSWRRLNPSVPVPGYDAEADARIDALLRDQPPYGTAAEGDIELARRSAGGAFPVPRLTVAPGGKHP